MTPDRLHIIEELQELAPGLAGISPVVPYQVPPDYFDRLPASILAKIKGLEEAGTVKDTELSGAEEMEMLSPFLSKLDKKTPFTAPDGYFEQFQPTVPATEKTPVIGMTSGNRFIRYAAAAVIAGVIVLGGWLLIDTPAERNHSSLALQQDSIADKEIKQKVQKVSDDEITNYIESENTAFLQETSVSSGDLNEEDMKLMLADVSDQELETYLQHDDMIHVTLN